MLNFLAGYHLIHIAFICSGVASLGLPLRLGSEVIILLKASMKFSFLHGAMGDHFPTTIELAQATFITFQKSKDKHCGFAGEVVSSCYNHLAVNNLCR